jgi:hypothetical protein
VVADTAVEVVVEREQMVQIVLSLVLLRQEAVAVVHMDLIAMDELEGAVVVAVDIKVLVAVVLVV